MGGGQSYTQTTQSFLLTQEHLPWKGFNTLDFHGSTRASWQMTTSRKHLFPFPELMPTLTFFSKSQKKSWQFILAPFFSKNEAPVLTGTTCKERDTEYTDGKQSTEFPLWKLILRVTKHIIPGNCFYLAITLTLQEGSWHWKQTVPFKNQGREFTEIPGHSHLNMLHYLQYLRILNQRLRVLFAEEQGDKKSKRNSLLLKLFICFFCKLKSGSDNQPGGKINWRSQWQYWDNILIHFIIFFL